MTDAMPTRDCVLDSFALPLRALETAIGRAVRGARTALGEEIAGRLVLEFDSMAELAALRKSVSVDCVRRGELINVDIKLPDVLGWTRRRIFVACNDRGTVLKWSHTEWHESWSLADATCRLPDRAFEVDAGDDKTLESCNKFSAGSDNFEAAGELGEGPRFAHVGRGSFLGRDRAGGDLYFDRGSIIVKWEDRCWIEFSPDTYPRHATEALRDAFHSGWRIARERGFVK